MKLLTLFLLPAPIAFAQLTDGVATSVSRTVTLTADEADFSIAASAALGTTQQQVAQVFLDAGVTGLTNTGTSLYQNTDYTTNTPVTQTLVSYQFAFSVPAAGLKDAANTLQNLGVKPPALLQSFQYSASLNASQATVDAMRQTLLPQLFADAQKKAQTLAAAAGLKLGGVKGVSESYNSTGSGGFANFLIGQFSSSIPATNTTTTAFAPASGGSGTTFTFYANVTYGVAQ